MIRFLVLLGMAIMAGLPFAVFGVAQEVVVAILVRVVHLMFVLVEVELLLGGKLLRMEILGLSAFLMFHRLSGIRLL